MHTIISLLIVYFTTNTCFIYIMFHCRKSPMLCPRMSVFNAKMNWWKCPNWSSLTPAKMRVGQRVVADTASGRRVSDSSTAERIHHCSTLCLPSVTCWEHCTERVCGSAQHKCGDWLVMSATGIGKAECAHISYSLPAQEPAHIHRKALWFLSNRENHAQ